MPARASVVVLVLTLGAIGTGCRSTQRHRVAAPATTTSTSTSSTTTSTTIPLVAWHGAVEHLFFHTLVIDPARAFTHDALGRGFANYFVTVGEFRSILAELYANGWTLVDIHRAVSGTVAVPPGRKPLVISEDDVNYYDYSRSRGLGWRLVLRPDGSVGVEVHDGSGVRVTDDDLVPIIDQFVASHPLFSVEGARGVLALTGYEGLFGERLDTADSVARAAALAARLRSDGWVLASHSYGHIDFSREGLWALTRDTEHWLAVDGPVVGPTDVFVYPFGAEPRSLASPTVQMLRTHGFTILCDINDGPRLVAQDGVTVMGRRHIDGIAFASPLQSRELAPLFDVASVEDYAARGVSPV